MHVTLTGQGAGACDGLIGAMRAEGWNVDVIEDMRHCAVSAASGACHMVVVVCHDPGKLERQAVRNLMSLRADMSVMFLVGEGWEHNAHVSLAGVTSDQIRDMSRPASELINVFREELRSVMLDRTQYSIMCIDDDREFLSSIKAFLPAHLRAAMPRFDLEFDFFDEPLEALAACQQIGDRLAVVVSDQVMPNVSGIELLTRLKELHPKARRVLLTGHAHLDSAVTAINRRILQKYVFKPVDPVDFSESIRLLLSEHHLEARGQTRQDRMMSQFEYIRAVTAAKTSKQILHTTLEFLCEQMAPTHALVALMQDDELVLRAANAQVPGLCVNKPIPTDDGIWAWMLQHRRPIRATRSKDLPENTDLPLPVMAVPVIRDNAFLGAILLSGRPRGGAFSREEGMLLNFVADVASVAFGSFKDREAVEKSYVSTMASLMETVEAKDSYTRGHTERVVVFATELAKVVGVAGQQLQELEWAAALHDIGKIALPDAILTKTGPLTADEYSIMKDHPTRADRILQHLKYLDAARMIIRAHHERYDGSGYPDGLTGEEIPLGARIMAIADSYDAMTSARPYRHAMDPQDALAEIEVNASSQFDPQLVAAFLTIMRSRATRLSPAVAHSGATS